MQSLLLETGNSLSALFVFSHAACLGWMCEERSVNAELL